MTAVLDLGTGFTEAVEQAVAKALADRATTTDRATTEALALRDRLWSGPPTVRLSMKELALAMGVSRQTIKRLMERGLPHRRNALGDYAFIVGEARTWLERQERVEAPVLSLRRTGS